MQINSFSFWFDYCSTAWEHSHGGLNTLGHSLDLLHFPVCSIMGREEVWISKDYLDRSYGCFISAWVGWQLEPFLGGRHRRKPVFLPRNVRLWRKYSCQIRQPLDKPGIEKKGRGKQQESGTEATETSQSDSAETGSSPGKQQDCKTKSRWEIECSLYTCNSLMLKNYLFCYKGLTYTSFSIYEAHLS